MRTGLHRNCPRETPPVAVEHGQGPQVARKVGHLPRRDITHGIQVRASVVGDNPLRVAGGAAGVADSDRIPLISGPLQFAHGFVRSQPRLVGVGANQLAGARVLSVRHIDDQWVAAMRLRQDAQSGSHRARKLGVGDHNFGFAMIHLPS